MSRRNHAIQRFPSSRALNRCAGSRYFGSTSCYAKSKLTLFVSTEIPGLGKLSFDEHTHKKRKEREREKKEHKLAREFVWDSDTAKQSRQFA